MILIPTLPNCSSGGDHGLIRAEKHTEAFSWLCLACSILFTIYRNHHSTGHMIYSRNRLGDIHYVDTRVL